MELCSLIFPSEKEIPRFFKDMTRGGAIYPVAWVALRRGCTLIIPAPRRYYLFEMHGGEVVYGIFSGGFRGTQYHIYFNGVVNPQRFIGHANI